MSWERDRRKLWKAKNVYDYISRTHIFNPFTGKVFFHRKAVNSSEQFCTKLWVLQMDLSLKWHLVLSVSCAGVCEEHTAHLLRCMTCISLIFPRHKLSRSGRGKPRAKAQLILQLFNITSCGHLTRNLWIFGGFCSTFICGNTWKSDSPFLPFIKWSS